MSGSEVVFAEEQAVDDLFENSEMGSDDRMFSRSQYIQHIQEEHAIRPLLGMDPVSQRTFSERRVKRDEAAERGGNNLSVFKMDEERKKGNKMTTGMQQLDPDYKSLPFTPSNLSSATEAVHGVERCKLNIESHELAKMVEEETQDVENILKMVAPDLPLREDRYALKKRVQRLRLNAESVMLLEESIVNHTPTADEAIVETPPETLARVMHTVEGGVTPECPPDQLFHTLFEEKNTERSVVLSSICPGLLQDVLVPQQLSMEIHKESLTPGLIELIHIYKNISDAKDWPSVDISDVATDGSSKKRNKKQTTAPSKPMRNEQMSWADHDLKPVVNIVGAEPAAVLDPAYLPDLETSGNLESTMSQGIEYFVEADPVQYTSRVQLRGSQPPPWFPGYIFALPEFPDVVKLAGNPDDVLTSSWKACHPKLIPDESISVLH